MAVYVPGRGYIDGSMFSVDAAVKEYDERLRFARNDETGDYCVFIKMPPGDDGGTYIDGFGPYLPILGFGDQIPEPTDALRRLHQADAMRHGEEILDRIDRENKERQRPYDEAVEQATGQVAEALEWGYRKMGAHPTTRIFVPDKG